MKTKASIIYAALVFTLGLLSLASCSKDNPQDQDEEDIEGSSDASYFVSQFVTLKSDGTVYPLKGYRFNEADDTEFTFVTETWEDAKSLFLGWLPMEAKPVVSDNSVSWEMYDAQGKSQGTIVLNKKDNDALVAEAKVPVNNPYVRTLRFVPSSSLGTNGISDWLSWLADAWNEFVGDDDDDEGEKDEFPSDDELLQDYFFGNVIYMDKDRSFRGYPTGDYIVFREYDPWANEKGIILRIDKAYHFYDDDVSGVKDRLRTRDEVRACSKIFVENKDFLEPLMKDADGNLIVGNYTANVASRYYNSGDFWNSEGWYVGKVKFNENKNSNDVGRFYPNANEICILYFGVGLNLKGKPVLTWE